MTEIDKVKLETAEVLAKSAKLLLAAAEFIAAAAVREGTGGPGYPRPEMRKGEKDDSMSRPEC